MVEQNTPADDQQRRHACQFAAEVRRPARPLRLFATIAFAFLTPNIRSSPLHRNALSRHLPRPSLQAPSTPSTPLTTLTLPQYRLTSSETSPWSVVVHSCECCRSPRRPVCVTTAPPLARRTTKRHNSSAPIERIWIHIYSSRSCSPPIASPPWSSLPGLQILSSASSKAKASHRARPNPHALQLQDVSRFATAHSSLAQA